MAQHLARRAAFPMPCRLRVAAPSTWALACALTLASSLTQAAANEAPEPKLPSGIEAACKTLPSYELEICLGKARKQLSRNPGLKARGEPTDSRQAMELCAILDAPVRAACAQLPR
jgi:hypothetical protein